MRRLILLAATAALVVGPAAWADQAQAKDKEHRDHGGGPPGLANKPYGMPPGQAKKMWRQGEHIPRIYYSETRYYVDPVRYRLRPPPPGYRWVLVEDDAYLVRRDNGLVADIVGNAIANLIR